MPELNKNTLLDLLNEIYMEILDPVVPITLADLSLRCNEFIPKVRPILAQEGYILESGEGTEEAEAGKTTEGQ